MIDAKTLESRWRGLVANRCGGAEFDKPGTGYSFSAVLAEERRLEEWNVPGDETSALCKLSVADPTWKMPPEAMQAGMDYYLSSPNATRYTDNNGIPGTHEGLAEYLNLLYSDSGVKFTPDWVQYSPGAIKRLLAEFVPSVLFSNDTILFFPDPSYGVIKSAINKRGAKIIDVPLVLSGGRWHVDYEKIASQLEAGKKALVYMNIPHNPAGITLSKDEQEYAIAWATKNGIILVFDEAYTHLRFDESGSVLHVAGWEQCCIVLQSVSKGWNATGLRFGWVVAHPTLIKAFRKVMDVKDSGGFGPSIASALWCLKNPGFASMTRDRYKDLHRGLFQGLQAAGFEASMPEAGLCQLTKAPRRIEGIGFGNATECSIWLRNNMRISTMPVTIGGQAWLRWAVTIATVPKCGLNDEASVIAEVAHRLKALKLEF